MSDWVCLTTFVHGNYCIWKEAIFKSGGAGLYRPITPIKPIVLSLMMFLALERVRLSDREGREQPMMFSAILIILCRAFFFGSRDAI